MKPDPLARAPGCHAGHCAVEAQQVNVARPGGRVIWAASPLLAALATIVALVVVMLAL